MLHLTVHAKVTWSVLNFIPSSENRKVNSSSFNIDRNNKLRLDLATNVKKDDNNDERFVSLSITFLEHFMSVVYERFFTIEAYIENRKIGKEIEMSNGDLNAIYRYENQKFFFPLSDIFDKQSKLLDKNSLTFVIYLSLHHQSKVPGLPKPSKLFNSECLSDFKIRCNDRDIPAHRAILYEKSDVFARMLVAPMKESATNEVIIEDMEGAVVLELIRYIYTGSADNIDELAMDLIDAAEKYQLPDLKLTCVNACSKNMTKENVFRMLMLADRYREQNLMENCESYIRMHYENMKDYENWPCFDNELHLKLFDMSQKTLEFRFRDVIPDIHEAGESENSD